MLILDAVLEHGTDSAEGRTAIRRMNQMHRSYDISNDDLRYVLATFVVTPMRWVDAYGWRRMTEIERIASANYYRDLGRHMGIRDVPDTWQGFSRLLDAYERDHFGLDPGGRTVAEATLALLATFPPNDKLPVGVVRRISLATMDAGLLDAFAFPHPRRTTRALVRTGSRRAAGWSASCRPARGPTSPASCRRSAAIRAGTPWPSSAPSRRAARCRTHGPSTSRPPRRSDAHPKGRWRNTGTGLWSFIPAPRPVG